MISLFDEFLSSPIALTVVLCSVLTGFIVTLLTLHAADTRVFDTLGKFIPSPSSTLWDFNMGKELSKARRRSQFSSEVCRIIREIGDGNIVGFNTVRGHQTVFVAHPDMIKAILSGHHMKFQKTNDVNRLKFFLGEGLYTSQGSKWSLHRQLAAPGFQAELMNSLIPNFNRQSQRLVSYWISNINKLRKVQPSANSIPVHLKTDLHSLIMSAMCYSCFSYDFQASSNRDAISTAFETIREEVGMRCIEPYEWWPLLYPARRQAAEHAKHVFHTLLDEVISQRLLEYSHKLHKRHAKHAFLHGTGLHSDSLDSVSTDTDDAPLRTGLRPPSKRHTISHSTGSARMSTFSSQLQHSSHSGRAAAGPGSLLARLDVEGLSDSPSRSSSATPLSPGPGLVLSPEGPGCINRVASVEIDKLEAATNPHPPPQPLSSPVQQACTNTNGTSIAGLHRERDLLDWLVECGDGMRGVQPSSLSSSDASSAGPVKLSRTEIRDHLSTFLLAGHEATTAALLWTIYELCMNPTVQTRCQAEIDNILMQDGVRRTYLRSEDVNKLRYLVQVLKEAMRLHPVSGSIARTCGEDCAVGAYRLKQGTTVVVSTLAVHTHPDYWTDALLFKPERFSRENIRATVKHPYQYLPFSAGPRSCVGQRLGLMEVLVVLASLLGQFTFALAAKDSKSVQSEERFTTHPQDLNVVVTLRSLSSSPPQQKNAV